MLIVVCLVFRNVMGPQNGYCFIAEYYKLLKRILLRHNKYYSESVCLYVSISNAHD